MTRSISFRPRDDEQEKAIDAYMLKHELKETPAMRDLLDKALNMENLQAILDSDNPLHCEALSYIDDHWECTWGRMGKTPDTKKIGLSDEARNNRCTACKKTLNMKERLLTMEQQLTKNKVIFYPKCKKGGKVNDNLDEMYCPEIGGRRPIKERKKKTDPQPCHAKGMNPYKRCPDIEWTQIVVKGKLPEGQNL